jgi:dipeptidyl aminopeptidase/acylaminoacyl peptidase
MTSYCVEDLYLHCQLDGLSTSTGHERVVYVCSRPDEERNTYRSVLWQLDLGLRSQPRALTSPDVPASSPSLSPDGSSVAFLSRRGDDKADQIYLLDLGGGEARRITQTDRETLSGIEGWSPDGKRLLATVSVPFAEDDRDDPGRSGEERPIVARITPYKQDGQGMLVGKRRHLRSVDVDTGEFATVTDGDHDVSGGCWSPDGKRLAYVRTREGKQRHLRDLWIADADGANARQVTHDLASVAAPRWSPDGTMIAFAASSTAGNSLSYLWLLDVDGGEPRLPAGRGLQLEGSHIAWHPSGERIAVVASVRGMFEIAVVDVASGDVHHFERRLRQVLSLAASQDALVYASATMRWPVELHACTWDGENERRITSANRSWAGRRGRPRVNVRRFSVPDGEGGHERIDAWILRPPGDGKGPFPVLMDMHGGPQSVSMIDFPSHVYWYALCSMGWMIVAPNAVGSAGYGMAFAKRLRGRWGELDLPQYLAILDTLREEGLADHRVACAGKSYGGFLSAWALGNSDAFRAAVICAPVANVESHTGTSDTGFYVTPYAMGAEIDDARERYQRLSPVDYCVEVSGAALLLQGQDDQRCPLGQSEELFASLIRHSRMPCTMVVYPGGSHGLAGSGNPRHRVDYHQRIVDWVATHAGRADADDSHCDSGSSGDDDDG